MNLDIIIKKLTKKQLRKLVLTQAEEITDLTCSLNSLASKLLKLRHPSQFANMDSRQAFELLKKEAEDEGGDEDYCEYCGEKIEECLGFAGNGLRCQDPIQKGDDPVIALGTEKYHE